MLIHAQYRALSGLGNEPEDSFATSADQRTRLSAGQSFCFWEDAIVWENHDASRVLRRPQSWRQTVQFHPRAG